MIPHRCPPQRQTIFCAQKIVRSWLGLPWKEIFFLHGVIFQIRSGLLALLYHVFFQGLTSSQINQRFPLPDKVRQSSLHFLVLSYLLLLLYREKYQFLSFCYHSSQEEPNPNNDLVSTREIQLNHYLVFSRPFFNFPIASDTEGLR